MEAAVGAGKKKAKKKLLRIYKNPGKLKQPVTERVLPTELSTKNEILNFVDETNNTSTILNNILKNVVIEILSIGDNDQDNYVYFNSNNDYIQLLEEYKLNTKFKRICKGGNIHHHISSNCNNFCFWYKRLIERIIGPHIVKKIFEDDDDNDVNDNNNNINNKKSNNENEFTVLYQFPPTIRIYNSHLLIGNNNSDNNMKENKYKNLGKMHCVSNNDTIKSTLWVSIY